MNQQLEVYIANLENEVSNISYERKEILNEIIEYIRSTSNPKLNFICTHNSRRSHLSQVWAQVMAYHHDVEVSTFSGGTEATAFHPNAVAALKRAGFKINHSEGENPKYTIEFSENAAPMNCFSKRFDNPINPKADFAAVMTCSEADADCPLVPGASNRIKLFYVDPKLADGTSEEGKTYDERCAQIACEMMYVFSRINTNK